MNVEELKEKLSKYKKEDIIITDHANLQALVRDIGIEEVKENVVNPKKLVYAKEEKALKPSEEKYDCYFSYSDNLCHRYILVLNRRIIIVTIIRINRDWQKTIRR